MYGFAICDPVCRQVPDHLPESYSACLVRQTVFFLHVMMAGAGRFPDQPGQIPSFDLETFADAIGNEELLSSLPPAVASLADDPLLRQQWTSRLSSMGLSAMSLELPEALVRHRLRVFGVFCGLGLPAAGFGICADWVHRQQA
jgi:hypothetical protein